MIGDALRMRLKLAGLRREHRIVSEAAAIPLSPPVDHPQILEGIASTCSLDLERIRFRKYAFGFPIRLRDGHPQLLFKHDRRQVAGEILDLCYDADGALRIRCRVDHPIARRCGAFSVGARVISYEMMNAASPDLFHALVTSAELEEISLTDDPANPEALVESRRRVSPMTKFYADARDRVAIYQRVLARISDTQLRETTT